MTALTDFLDDPPAFLRTNYVRFRGACSLAPGAVGDFMLIDLNGRPPARGPRLVFGVEVGRTDARAFEIRQADAANVGYGSTEVGTFQAVWSGYQSGAAVRCTLGTAGPDIMLTQDLSGCTIVSSAAPSGPASFSHYNLLQPADPARPAGPRHTLGAEAMRSYAAGQHSGPHSVVTKEDYYDKAKRGGAGRATAVGWRRDGTWEFWVQYVEEHDGVVRIREVSRMQAGTRFG